MDTPVYPPTGRRSRTGTSRTATSGPSTRRARCPSSSCRRSSSDDRGLPRRLRVADGALRRRAACCSAVALAGLGARSARTRRRSRSSPSSRSWSARSSSPASTSGRPRCRGRARALVAGAPARLRPARRGGRREALSGRALPLAVAYVWRRRGAGRRSSASGMAAAWWSPRFLPFLVLAPGGVWHGVGRAAVAAAPDREPRRGALARAHHLFGLGVEMRSGHGSQNLGGRDGVAALPAQRASSSPRSSGSGCAGRRPRAAGALAPRRWSRSSPSGRCSRRST